MSYDLSLFRPAPPGPATQVLADALDNGRTVTGLPKLVQRFTLELLTSQGSVPRSEDGCLFVSRLMAGRASSEMDVLLAFTASLGQVVKNLQAAQLPDDPPEEQLARVRIDGLTLGQGTVSLRLTVTSAAGVSQGVTLPLDFLLS